MSGREPFSSPLFRSGWRSFQSPKSLQSLCSAAVSSKKLFLQYHLAGKHPSSGRQRSSFSCSSSPPPPPTRGFSFPTYASGFLNLAAFSKAKEAVRRGRDPTPRPPPAARLGFSQCSSPARSASVSAFLHSRSGNGLLGDRPWRAPKALQRRCRLRTRTVPQTTSLQGQQLRHSSTCYPRELLSLEAARGAIVGTASKHSGGGACALALGLSGLLPLG